MVESGEVKKSNNFKKQMFLYFFFALCMIILNYLIQKSNQLFFAPFICHNLGSSQLIKTLYCATNPYNMPELVGSIVAVVITYLVKFTLDKFIVFEKKSTQLKETSQEFFKYFGFAILTTIENICIQFILTNFVKTPLEISVVIALSIGYFTKYLLDRKYVFITSD
ncbi:MAG: GtrA family protein [Candidatus Hermodarchaeota archaeon]